MSEISLFQSLVDELNRRLCLFQDGLWIQLLNRLEYDPTLAMHILLITQSHNKLPIHNIPRQNRLPRVLPNPRTHLLRRNTYITSNSYRKSKQHSHRKPYNPSCPSSPPTLCRRSSDKRCWSCCRGGTFGPWFWGGSRSRGSARSKGRVSGLSRCRRSIRRWGICPAGIWRSGGSGGLGWGCILGIVRITGGGEGFSGLSWFGWLMNRKCTPEIPVSGRGQSGWWVRVT